MGDLQLWPQQLDGISAADDDHNRPSPPSPAAPSSTPRPPNPHHSAISADAWMQAEQATQEVIHHILPTVVSEQRRKAVVDYVQKLMKGFLNSEVFPFGSVPLKTYLPDGDIDLTTVSFPNIEDALAADVRSVLEVEAHNKDAEFEVKDVQLILAEVKLVKCLVQNIVVDISFNQIGGLCTLCFLEQVDHLIGKDHLFKRSIILIKAWCYYESRILGAQHGLISTYALETLILYIFHLFHSSLHGPLAVLYKFLDYYSKFDWDNFCVSLNGPVSVSSLLELPAAETVETDGGNLLLTKEFFRSCVDNFSVAPKGSDSRNFIKKHLNIVDPLRESNNLGRSVSKGNFYRIRSAFSYGAWKLGRLLLLPGKSIANEVNMFFLNTIDRHGSGERPDVQDLIPRCLDGASDLVNGIFAPSAENIEKEHADKQSSESLTTDACIDSTEGNKNIRISSLDGYDDRVPLQRQSSYNQKNVTNLESGGVEVDGAASFVRIIDDAKDLASVRASVSTDISENYSTSVSTSEAGISSFGKAYHVPHTFYVPENGNGKDLTSDTINSVNLGSLQSVSFNRASGSPEEMSNSVQLDSCETDSSSSCTSSTSNHGSAFPSESLHFANFANQTPSGNEWNDTNGSYNVPNKFSDLTGDYEMHFRSLSYARWCQEQITMTYFLPIHQSPTYAYHQSRDAWSRGSMYTPMNANGVTPRPPFSPGYYPINLPFFPSTYGPEPKPRGTGTYFPNTNHRVYKERQYPGRGKNPMTANQFPRPRINGRADISHDKNLEKGPHEPATQFGGSGRGRPPVLDIPHLSFRPALKGSPHANGINLPTDYGRLEFGSLGPVSFGTLSLENGNSHSQDSGFPNPALIEQRPAIHSNTERSSQSYQLKDEVDFPPLSG
ncbi:uncharacterized protein LOC110104016 [Dendrobium catenatum]|uniref:uncharacterized protein LOC110104016 n=1 Tax=Dendrobium catenatum TaxID=906689 RepID=UPI0009F4A90C|nr:uncharacterized protein LOC110104016 [Dendrobium catenatum]